MKKIITVCGHSFLLLNGAKIALDCGANNGKFSEYLNKHSRMKIYSFEPDPRLFSVLPKLPNVTWHPLAIDGDSGEFDLALGESLCSSAVYNVSANRIRVKKTSLDDFCAAHGIQKIDFIKLDIEGAELNLLEKAGDTLLCATKQITVEFHEFLNKDDLPRIKKIVARLESLGFYFIKFSYHTWGDCLFLNTRLVHVSCFDKIFFCFIKWFRGFCRITKPEKRSRGKRKL